MKLGLIYTLAAAGTLVAGSSALQAEPVKIGVLATLEGTYTALGQDGIRGLRVALSQAGNMMGDREVEDYHRPHRRNA